MLTETEFEKLCKQIMDKQLRPFLRDRGIEFSSKEQEVFWFNLKLWLYQELNKMNVWDQLMK